jgi:hypothetical protein
MPITLLHRIAREGLPWSAMAMRDVEDIRLLVMAGHVKATFAPSAAAPAAVVTAITSLGRQVLRSFPPGGS